MASSPRIKPVVNQIEVHPFNTQIAIRETCAKHGIAVQAYAPLARALRMTHPTIVELAGKYGCTAAQLLVKYVHDKLDTNANGNWALLTVFCRWGLQHGMITLPKSIRKERMMENADVANFEISADDMATMDGLDEKLVTDWYGSVALINTTTHSNNLYRDPTDAA